MDVSPPNALVICQLVSLPQRFAGSVILTPIDAGYQLITQLALTAIATYGLTIKGGYFERRGVRCQFRISERSAKYYSYSSEQRKLRRRCSVHTRGDLERWRNPANAEHALQRRLGDVVVL